MAFRLIHRTHSPKQRSILPSDSDEEVHPLELIWTQAVWPGEGLQGGGHEINVREHVFHNGPSGIRDWYLYYTSRMSYVSQCSFVKFVLSPNANLRRILPMLGAPVPLANNKGILDQLSQSLKDWLELNNHQHGFVHFHVGLDMNILRTYDNGAIEVQDDSMEGCTRKVYRSLVDSIWQQTQDDAVEWENEQEKHAEWEIQQAPYQQADAAELENEQEKHAEWEIQQAAYLQADAAEWENQQEKHAAWEIQQAAYFSQEEQPDEAAEWENGQEVHAEWEIQQAAYQQAKAAAWENEQEKHAEWEIREAVYYQQEQEQQAEAEWENQQAANFSQEEHQDEAAEREAQQAAYWQQQAEIRAAFEDLEAYYQHQEQLEELEDPQAAFWRKQEEKYDEWASDTEEELFLATAVASDFEEAPNPAAAAYSYLQQKEEEDAYWQQRLDEYNEESSRRDMPEVAPVEDIPIDAQDEYNDYAEDLAMQLAMEDACLQHYQDEYYAASSTEEALLLLSI